MNLYEKLAAITDEIGVVAKNLNVETGKNKSYKAVSERDVLDAVKPLEKKYGVYSYPASRETLESLQLESESSYNGQTTKRTTFYTRMKTIYRFVNTEKPEEYIETTVFSVGLDSQDKGDGKAMTYADKFALLKAYKISTGEDPDQEGSEESDYRKVEKKQATQPKPVQKKEDSELEKQAESLVKREGEQEYAICESCGGYIYPVQKKDKSTMSVKEFLIAGLRDFNAPLCKTCYINRVKANNA